MKIRIILIIVCVAVVLPFGLVMEYYNALVWIMEVFVMGILHNFGKDNNCRMCRSSIGIGIGNGNIILVW